jgi:hypothetical protein
MGSTKHLAVASYINEATIRKKHAACNSFLILGQLKPLFFSAPDLQKKK